MKLSDLSENRQEILSLYSKKEEEVIEDIHILREWLSKQPHLPSETIQGKSIMIFRNYADFYFYY